MCPRTAARRTSPPGRLTRSFRRRPARRSANFSSLANASRWQGGWNTSFAGHYGQTAKPQHTALTKNNNRNAYGRAEQQRATVYNPWPSAGALYPKAV